MSSPRQKFLVRMPNWIGDAVMSVPALCALRQRFPQACITLLAKPHIATLFEAHPDIDDMVVFEAPGQHEGLMGRWRLSQFLKKKHFDIALLFQNALEAALISVAAGIPKRFGYATDGRGPLLTGSLNKRHAPAHRTDAYLALVGLIEPDRALHPRNTLPKQNPYLVVTTPERRAAYDQLKSLGLSGKKAIVGLNAGAAYGTAKRWSPAHFAAAADLLAEKYQMDVVIFGGKSDIDLAEEIQLTMAFPSVVLAGLTTIRQMMASLAACRLLVTNDSGPMHVASALGVPQIAIFGPTIPTATFSRGPSDVLMQGVADCAPCRYRECPTDHRCMDSVSVEAVFQAAEEQLALTPKKDGAIFLDRDGTINSDEDGYIDSTDRFSLYPGAAAAIARLNRRGKRVFVVSNQSGIARKKFDDVVLSKLNLYMARCLAKEGAYLDAIYTCPHHPDWFICDCRKPEPGMLRQAEADFPVDLSCSYIIGDKNSDLGLAREGLKGVLVLTGEGATTEKTLSKNNPPPAYIAKDLADAVDWILSDLNTEKKHRGESNGDQSTIT